MVGITLRTLLWTFCKAIITATNSAHKTWATEQTPGPSPKDEQGCGQSEPKKWIVGMWIGRGLYTGEGAEGDGGGRRGALPRHAGLPVGVAACDGLE